MQIIKDVLVSDNLINTKFACNTKICQGACCVEGDSGAPLEKDEINIIQKNIEAIKPYMDKEGLDLLAKDGFHEKDSDKEECTTCLPNGACVFVKFDGALATCAIENAHSDGALDFKKPISCHLYPVRIKQIGEYMALNYHKWDICSPACDRGKDENIMVSDFLKEPLIRKFGEEWYTEFNEVMQQLRLENKE